MTEISMFDTRSGGLRGVSGVLQRCGVQQGNGLAGEIWEPHVRTGSVSRNHESEAPEPSTVWAPSCVHVEFRSGVRRDVLLRWQGP